MWEADTRDPADYRLTAEHFWGVHSNPDTYTFGPLWRPEWSTYLRTIPFRQVGTGTIFLATGWVRLGHAPRSQSDIAAAGQSLVAVESVLLVAGLLAVFWSVRRAYGVVVAMLVLAALVFPPRLWRMTEDLLTEPILRILLLFLFAAVVRITRGRASPVQVLAVPILLLVAVHVKVQWLVAVPLLVPLVLLIASETTAPPVRATLILAAAIPATVIAVNWIGWRSLAIAPGTGVHAHIKYGEGVLNAFCAPLDPRPGFCDPSSPRIQWWNLHFAGDRADFQALDQAATRDLLRHPLRAAREFLDGLALASTLPGTESIVDGRLRLVDYAPPWIGLIGFLDQVVWTLLGVGLWVRRTRLIAWTALVMWIVPAFGNIVAVYELRYHQPMAGFGLAATIMVAAECRHLIAWPEWRRLTRANPIGASRSPACP